MSERPRPAKVYTDKDLAPITDCQVWLERVDSTGKVGFVLENGALKAPDDAQAAE